MKKQIINISELDYKPFPMPLPEAVKAKYEGARMGQAGQIVGAQKLGFNVTVVPPGKRAYPFHSHRVNEEFFYIIEGEGTVRIGTETFPIKTGDLISCPPGGPETAHQIVNTSEGELRYLAISTKLSPEIAQYPDSCKLGILADFGTDASGKPNIFRMLIKEGQQPLDYWEGEE